MEELLASLSRRQTMLLLTAVTFGGAEGVASLEHLPDEEAELLRDRATRLLAVPRERRLPQLAQEIKRLVTQRRSNLWSVNPEVLAGLLRQERAALVEMVLRALPSVVADSVRMHLPPQPKLTARREVRPGVLNVVRWKLERLLDQASGRTLWKFSDLLSLKPREMLTLADRFGARVLGPALAALPEEERQPFVDALPPGARLLVGRTIAAAQASALAEPEARRLLAAHGFGEADPQEALWSAGVYRLTRAAAAQSPEFVARLVERQRPPLGPLFSRWAQDEELRASARGDGGRADVVADLERLEGRGMVDAPIRLPPIQRKPSSAPEALPGGKLVPPAPRGRGEPSSTGRRSSESLVAGRRQSEQSLPGRQDSTEVGRAVAEFEASQAQGPARSGRGGEALARRLERVGRSDGPGRREGRPRREGGDAGEPGRGRPDPDGRQRRTPPGRVPLDADPGGSSMRRMPSAPAERIPLDAGPGGSSMRRMPSAPAERIPLDAEPGGSSMRRMPSAPAQRVPLDADPGGSSMRRMPAARPERGLLESHPAGSGQRRSSAGDSEEGPRRGSERPQGGAPRPSRRRPGERVPADSRVLSPPDSSEEDPEQEPERAPRVVRSKADRTGAQGAPLPRRGGFPRGRGPGEGSG